MAESSLLPQPHPSLRNHDRVSGVLGIVTDGRRQAETAGMQVDELAQVGNVLRSLVRHSGNVVLEDQQDGLFLFLSRKFLNVNNGAVRDAADVVEPLAALPLQIF